MRCRVQAYPEQTFDGHVSAIDAKVDGNTRNVLVRARVPNTASTLLPGMFVSVEVIVGDAEEQSRCPSTALSYNLYGDSVFVVAERARRTGARSLPSRVTT